MEKLQRLLNGFIPFKRPTQETAINDDEVLCNDCKVVDCSSLPAKAAKGCFDHSDYLHLRSLNATFEELLAS